MYSWKGIIMSYLNYQFLEEYKLLDNLCRDIYGTTPDNKLGVTLYLEDMDRKGNHGSIKIPEWTSDYNHLKNIRNARNELVHSRNSISYDICSQYDIDFIRSFKTRILNQTDPIALLRKQTSKTHTPYYQQGYNPQPTYSQPQNTHNVSRGTHAGCLSIIALFLIVAACIIAFLF